MPTIKISQDLYEELSALAIGFETPETVMQRLVDEHKNSKIASKNKPPRKKITLELIKTIHPLAKAVFEEKKNINAAVDYLQKEMGMNRKSARGYIIIFGAMKRGERYEITINRTATRYYLTQILAEDGKDGLRTALVALWKHIKHFEQFIAGQMESNRAIHEEFFAKLRGER